MAGETLTILHFNDVYNIDPQVHEPQGGAARMAEYVKSVKHLNPLVLFSGDALNPSLMSIFLKGEQMVPILNAIGVHCAVYGNHDFDFGVDHLEDMAEKCDFPWLLSNIIDKTTDQPLANGKVKHMIDWDGMKVGLIGLVEQEWIDTLATVDPEDIIFLDFVEIGNKLAAELREEGADIVIALTHMRWPNDRKVARNVDVDIVLGGHDHDYIVEKVEGKYVVKSGTDFRNLSNITVTKNGTGFDIDIKPVDLDSSVTQDSSLKAEVDKHVAEIHSKMDEYLGSMGVSMDGRFSEIRSRETNLGNFICDIILEAVPADICLLNSGTFRSDRVHSKGPFKLRDLMTILPMVDLLCVIEISGRDIIKALENGVSQYPKLEGRFPQVAGLEFGFDPSKPPGERVEPLMVKVQGQYIDLDKKYRLCTKEYIAGGKDGYDVFKDCPVVVWMLVFCGPYWWRKPENPRKTNDLEWATTTLTQMNHELESSEQCPSISTAARNHFESVQIVRNEKPCRSGHRQSLCSIVRRSVLIRRTISAFSSGINCPRLHGDTISAERSLHMIAKSQSLDAVDAAPEPPALASAPASAPHSEFIKPEVPKIGASEKKKSFKNLAHSVVRQMSIHDIEKEQVELCPRVEGRIFQYDDKRRQHILSQRIIGGQSIVDEIIEASSEEEIRRKLTGQKAVKMDDNFNQNENAVNMKPSGSEISTEVSNLKRKHSSDNGVHKESATSEQERVKKTKTD